MSNPSSSKQRLKKQFSQLDSSLGSHWNSVPKPRRAASSNSASPAPPDTSRQPQSPLERPQLQDEPVSASATAQEEPRPVGRSGTSSSFSRTPPSRPKPGSVSSNPPKDLAPRPTSTSPATGSSMSQRNRGQRTANRNSEVGEEYGLWRTVEGSMNSIAAAVNESSQNVNDILAQDKQMAGKRDAGDYDKRDATGSRPMLKADLSNIDALLRSGVKVNEKTAAQIKQTIENLKVLSAIQKAKEEAQEPSFSRSATQRAKETAAASSSVYDFDGSGDSSVPSPNPSVARRMGGSTGSKGDRGSVPPSGDRSTPVAKAGSVEPQGSAANIARSKVIFSKGEEVAFKPKPQNSEPTDWILGVVQDVRGEGKSRRYRVLDADVDEAGKQKEFRSSASSMIGIPKEGTPLPPLDPGKVVLALYPNTTTLYKAEVHGMDVDGKVNLKFEGEESSNTVQAVARRYVVEYRA
ncbi:saga complex subunit sgf29 [Seiridium cupressi]|uniref:SGF29 C-terminal domain-containing protein n=1 Tax=Seiridium unicorne TaxID=138068 RepID=A0ABR2UIP4_9PEZI